MCLFYSLFPAWWMRLRYFLMSLFYRLMSIFIQFPIILEIPSTCMLVFFDLFSFFIICFYFSLSLYSLYLAIPSNLGRVSKLNYFYFVFLYFMVILQFFFYLLSFQMNFQLPHSQILAGDQLDNEFSLEFEQFLVVPYLYARTLKG